MVRGIVRGHHSSQYESYRIDGFVKGYDITKLHNMNIKEMFQRMLDTGHLELVFLGAENISNYTGELINFRMLMWSLE